MKKVFFLGLLSLAVSLASAQNAVPAPKDGAAVEADVSYHAPLAPSSFTEPTVNNGVNNTVNIYPPAPVGAAKSTGKTTPSWKNHQHDYCRWNYFRKIEQYETWDSYWKGKYEGFREGLDFEKQKAPVPPGHIHDDSLGEGFLWFLVLLLVGSILYFLLRRDTVIPPPAATSPVIVYPPAPVAPAPASLVPPASSELIKLMKENGGTMKVGSDGSWNIDIHGEAEGKKEKTETGVKESQQ